ncbi:MAG TPA: hypothetical protein VGL61_13160 [Kofleriaceae bacterium]
MEFLIDFLFDAIPDAIAALLTRDSPRRRFERELEELARELGGNYFMDLVHLEHDGAAIRIGYARRRGKLWTELEVDLPRGYPFALDGVDGAPAEVVSHFIDAPLRDLLRRERAAELTTRFGNFVRLSIARPITNGGDARAIVHTIARIPRRLRDAYAEAERAHAVDHEGGPYREDPSGRAERDLRAAWADEVDQLIARRALRR